MTFLARRNVRSAIPKGDRLVEHVGRRAFTIYERCPQGLHGIRERRPIYLRRRLREERLGGVGGLSKPRDPAPSSPPARD